LAGRQKEKRLRIWLEQHAKDELENPHATILDWACERIEGGATIQSLAAELSALYPDGVNRVMLHRILHKLENADERIAHARRRAAPILVEEAQDILDNAKPQRDELAKAKLTADIRLWQAERLDRGTYGREPLVQLTQNSLTISDLHLDALARIRPLEPERPALPSSSPAEARSAS